MLERERAKLAQQKEVPEEWLLAAHVSEYMKKNPVSAYLSYLIFFFFVNNPETRRNIFELHFVLQEQKLPVKNNNSK